MSYLQLEFFVFLALVVAVYYALPLRARPYVLFASSLAFLYFRSVYDLLFAVALCAIAWAGGMLLQKEKPARASVPNSTSAPQQIHTSGRISAPQQVTASGRISAPQRARVLLAVFLCALVGTLAVMKLTRVLAHFTGDTLSLIQPVGISYYSLSLIGYVLDVYYGRVEAARNPAKFCLFALWFPAVLQGPFSRYGTLSEQLSSGHRFQYESFCKGLQLILYGLLKKMVVADRIALYTTQVFGNINSYSGVQLLLGLILRSLHLYFDFSGCMEIAEGISELFGVRLPANFRQPFFAQSAAEFWRRWHITLGEWFKDYVYYPVSGTQWCRSIKRYVYKRRGMAASNLCAMLIPLAIVWILTGLWHGTGLPYLLWGLYWFCLIGGSSVFGKQCKQLAKLLHINMQAGSWKLFRMVRTFALFTIGRWISMDNGAAVFVRMIRVKQIGTLFDRSIETIGWNRYDILVVAAALLVQLMIDLYKEKHPEESLRDIIGSCNLLVRWLIYDAAVLCVLLLGVYGFDYNVADFVYMQF